MAVPFVHIDEVVSSVCVHDTVMIMSSDPRGSLIQK